MKKLDLSTVSWRGLLCFEAAARTGSFTRAAEELRLGQPAVSHAVKALEERLGVRLFERGARGVALSAAGGLLVPALQRAMAEISAALEAARSEVKADSAVRLSVSSSLANYWLLPRLAGFKRAHPDIELAVISRDNDAAMIDGDFDLAIPLGAGSWRRYHRWHFCPERVVPVCSPALAESLGLHSAADLQRRAHLIHLEERYRGRCNWDLWFQSQGLPGVAIERGDRFNDYSIVIQAALSGQGVALGWWHIVAPLLAEGRLVAPLRAHYDSGEDFVLVAPRARPLTPDIETLRRWLLDQSRAAHSVPGGRDGPADE